MEWCCETFEGWFQQAGKRGAGVFARVRRDSTASFILQFRALDRGEAAPAHTESPMTLVSDIHILYCPWCGTNLQKKYASCVRKVDRSELSVGPDLTSIKA